MKPKIYQLLSISSLLVSISLMINSLDNSASAQITATPNDAGTVVNQSGNTLNINGGTQTGTNLFHSFEKFGVNNGQTANFISTPEIKNILGRVTGGDASVINGLIKVTGSNANLYLMNPAGIIFGSGARLDIPGSFTATTASGIGFGDNWFNAFGANNYADLVGEPNSFAFTVSQPGGIFNAGNLEVGKGETLNLLGGNVINTGALKSEGGNINVAAIPGEKLVRITQEGSLLSLGLPTSTTSKLNPVNFTPRSLPKLLTGGNLNNATGVTVENGVIKLTGSGVEIPNDVGTAIVSGNVDVSGDMGGTANVLGKKVGIIDGNINAAGKNGGGTVLIGGDYKGEGTVPNAKRTVISKNSVIKADAFISGNGGKVIAWADETTIFQGTISARGGKNSGDGGFVEVSGKENLAFDGFVDVGADFGKGGELLLDPKSVEIVENGNNDNQLNNKQEILKDNNPNNTFKISANKIVEALSRGDVTIEATENIDVNSRIDAFFRRGNTDNNFDLTLTAPFINVDNSFVGVQGNLNLFGTDELNIEGSQIASKNGNIKLESSSGNVTLLGTELSSTGEIEVRSPGIVKLSETTGDSGKPFVARAKGNINIEGNTGIEITAFENPDSILRSGGDFNLVSNTNIIGNALISSGGSFNAGSGSLTQSALSLNGIISSNGDVNFGDYTGSSLKVEAKGSIRGGNINIDEAGAFPQTDDPDINILNAGPAVILRAGVENLQHSPDNSTSRLVEGTDFTFPGDEVSTKNLPGSIEVGNITTAQSPVSIHFSLGGEGYGYLPTDSVILQAVGDIKAGDIRTRNGSVQLKTTIGNIIVNTINTNTFFPNIVNGGNLSIDGGGNVNIDSGGIFRAEGSFTQSFPSGAQGDRVEKEVSILTAIFKESQPEIGGDINIRHRGEEFVESYPFSTITPSDNISTTRGNVFIRSNFNQSVYGSLLDQELFDVGLPSSDKITVTINPPPPPTPPQPPELNQDKNNICSPQSSTVATNSENSTRDASSNNNPCKKTNDKDNILKVIPDNRFNSNSVLPTSLLELGER